MFTCSHCSFQHPFEWAIKEHIYVKHGVASDMTPRRKIPRAPTQLRVGSDGERAPTKVSVPPIKRYGAQSGMGVENEDSESEHGDTEEETVDDDEQSLHESEETVDDDYETVDEEMDADDEVDEDGGKGDDDNADDDVDDDDGGEGDDDDDVDEGDDGEGNDDDMTWFQ